MVGVKGLVAQGTSPSDSIRYTDRPFSVSLRRDYIEPEDSHPLL